MPSSGRPLGYHGRVTRQAGRTHAGIVLAAGSGTRVGNSRNKVYLPLAGRRILTWSLELFGKLPGIGRLVLVVRDEDRELAAEVLDHELACYHSSGEHPHKVTCAGRLLASTACATAVIRSPRIRGTSLGLPRRRGPSRLDQAAADAPAGDPLFRSLRPSTWCTNRRPVTG